MSTIAIIKGDIVSSRKISNQEKWIKPLKDLLGTWGKTPKQWELVWGDFFQLEIEQPEEALRKALIIKSLIKQTLLTESNRRNSTIDVRMAIGIGEKSYSAKRISESNGSAFVFAGEKFDTLRKEKTNLAFQSPWQALDEEINLYLKLANTFMDKWSVSSAELVKIVLENPNISQQEIGEQLGIKQNSVSNRWRTANIDEIKTLDKVFRKRITQHIR